jgi:hypothetical protein
MRIIMTWGNKIVDVIIINLISTSLLYLKAIKSAVVIDVIAHLNRSE